MALIYPPRTPVPGYYYHYKHDPDSIEVCNCAYRVMGIGAHTEEDGTWFVNYLPLYDASVVSAGRALGITCFDNRPLAMWMGEVEVQGIVRPRFSLVTDSVRLEVLTAKYQAMYGAAFQ